MNHQNSLGPLPPDEFRRLLQASDDELRALLGIEALALVTSPAEVLTDARSGRIGAAAVAAFGPADKSSRLADSGYFKGLAERFVKQFARELRSALCGNEELYKEEKQRGLNELHLLAAAVAATLTTAIPLFAPLAGLVGVLAVIIAKAGLQAFCRSLDDPKRAP